MFKRSVMTLASSSPFQGKLLRNFNIPVINGNLKRDELQVSKAVVLVESSVDSKERHRFLLGLYDSEFATSYYNVSTVELLPGFEIDDSPPLPKRTLLFAYLNFMNLLEVTCTTFLDVFVALRSILLFVLLKSSPTLIRLSTRSVLCYNSKTKMVILHSNFPSFIFLGTARCVFSVKVTNDDAEGNKRYCFPLLHDCC